LLPDTIAHLYHLASKRRHSSGVIANAIVTGNAHIRVADSLHLVHSAE